MKFIKIKNYVKAFFSNGTTLAVEDCNEETYAKIKENAFNEENVKRIMSPEYEEIIRKHEEQKETEKRLLKSKHIKKVNDSYYLFEISELSVPMNLLEKFIEAEETKDENLVNSYLNFWTLMSTNNDSRVRTNLFWFLDKYGFQITSSGLFVAYRLVLPKVLNDDINYVAFVTDAYIKVKKIWRQSPHKFTIRTSEDLEYSISGIKKGEEIVSLHELYQEACEQNVFTDQRTKKMRIKLGTPVSISREKCDPCQENTCSKGLHAASADWLQRNSYFGKVPLLVLINPADVVAVPPDDGYGKLRCCKYYPVQVLRTDEENNVIFTVVEDGAEDDFLDIIIYDAEKSTEESAEYCVDILHPELTNPSYNLKQIKLRLESKESRFNGQG